MKYSVRMYLYHRERVRVWPAELGGVAESSGPMVFLGGCDAPLPELGEGSGEQTGAQDWGPKGLTTFD